MTDLISRQAAINTLAEMHCKSDEDGYVWIIRSDAWSRIDALPFVEPEQRWIPVGENLPKNDESVLVTDNREDVYRDTFHKSDDEGIFELDTLCVYAVAWMPLPEPYREGEEDE